MTYSIGHLTISIPIGRADRQIALRFAREQPTPDKSEQVYLNTLAVLVVNRYLEMLEIPTSLTSSYSWNRVGRMCANVADIDIPGIGHLECRSLRSGERCCAIPPDVWHDRIGYIIVRLDEHFSEGTLLGFVPQVAQMTVDVDRLQSLDTLLVRLHNLERSEITISPPVSDETIADFRRSNRSITDETVTHLSQWFDDIFDVGWQAIDRLLGRSAPCLDFRFRSPNLSSSPSNSDDRSLVRRGKSIDLGIQLSGCSVVLLVELRKIENNKVDVRLQVHPTGGNIYLSPNLQLGVRDRASHARLQTQSRQSDNYIQLRLVGDPGDRFSATLSLNSASVTEEFEI
ncbi:MAG: DUF1822 family protein [Cyanobacteria bacterium J055]|nr:MAG: DUF1822 family protein [Cyanobacteria bacterium J055]